MDNNKKKIKMFVVSSDGKSMEAEPFAGESGVVDKGYMYDYAELSLDIKSSILYKVRDFCVGRNNILNNDPADQNHLLQHKLNDFNSKFLQQNLTDAIPLMSAAFKMEIKSLVDLMMKDVVSMLTQMSTKDIYDIFFVNLKEFDVNVFEAMVGRLYWGWLPLN